MVLIGSSGAADAIITRYGGGAGNYEINNARSDAASSIRVKVRISSGYPRAVGRGARKIIDRLFPWFGNSRPWLADAAVIKVVRAERIRHLRAEIVGIRFISAK